jgi:hypothetical protein
LAISSAILIRLGGLLAIVGGLAATILGLLYVLQAWGMTLDFTAMALQKGHYETPVATILVIGVLAAMVALHIVQRRHYGRWGALAAIAPIAGVAMVVIGFQGSALASDTAFSLGIGLLTVGVLVATIGFVGFGIVTISAGVMPRWCGIAIIAGSPLGVMTLLIFSTLLVMARILPGEIGWALAGIPRIVVGYGAFRAARRGTVRPTRVR